MKERGSIEVVILVVVVAAIIGVVAWRIAETQKTQLDTQAAVENSNTTPQSNTVTVSSMNLKFTVPEGNGSVTTMKPTGGDMPTVTLVSKKLKDAKYSCEGENSGTFGTLGVVDASAGAPVPSYSKEVSGKTYGFTSSLDKNCYDAALLTAFRETVPKGIVDTLQPTEAAQN